MQSETIGACCTSLYESKGFKLLLGESWHPGGLDLTRELAQMLAVKPEDSVLDVACGVGTTPLFLAQNFGCKVLGVDLSEKNIQEARRKAQTLAASNTEFKLGEAGELPVQDESFDVALSECTLSIFPTRQRALQEMFRVLKPSGRVGITDMTLNGRLPDELQSPLSHFLCLSNAATSRDLLEGLRDTGFQEAILLDRSDTLIALLESLKKKLLPAEILTGLGKIELPAIRFDQIHGYLRMVREAVGSGALGYAVVTARKKVSS